MTPYRNHHSCRILPGFSSQPCNTSVFASRDTQARQQKYFYLEAGSAQAKFINYLTIYHTLHFRHVALIWYANNVVNRIRYYTEVPGFYNNWNQGEPSTPQQKK